ncbi:hypothetical protein DL766_008277 [Monosporascus sp. MC13-8B]|uniref:WSC domain-containing protein n=1 Tax=Monosporascus cannonballus TaxID=155416 RepID=A0ABY0H4E0_9PEZI|nr:hypothetical protein DL762_005792 [Monosporascus cannonballus]RYO85338.1 hypothetical protein DL763_007153 [Monosporascus cannonballus]RYP20141.1 hypothetical protein DL766_008277 [Monosporascus sp. MC13-8B]
MSLRQYVVAAVLAGASVASAGLQPPPQSPIRGTETVRGCFSSVGELKLLYDDKNIYNSRGKCNEKCRAQDKNVAATILDACYCGDKYPPSSAKVADNKCSEPCPGFDKEACGGLNTYSVYNTGMRITVDESEDVQSSSKSNSPTSTTTTAPSSTATTTPTQSTSAPAETASETAAPESGPNTIGIAVGVVCGILAVGAACGAAYFYMRRRRNEEIEEEHRRNAAVNAFITGGKPPGSSGGLSMSDSRLDPVMVNRRLSDGSIADNQDYSRRILRVTNA